MSFLSALSKIGGFATKLLPIPGAGFAGDALSMAGEAAGNMGAARAKGRQDELAANLALAREKENATMDRANLDLNRRQYGDQARRQAISEVMRSDMMSGLKRGGVTAPAGIPVVQFNGGLNADRFGDATHQAGSELSRQAMARLLNGPEFSDVPMQDYDAMVPHANALDKILNGVSYAGTISKGLGVIPRGQSPVMNNNAAPKTNVDHAFGKIRF